MILCLMGLRWGGDLDGGPYVGGGGFSGHQDPSGILAS